MHSIGVRYRRPEALCALGERNDIIRRIHRELAEPRIERTVTDFALDGGDATRPTIGHLVTWGLDHELHSTA